MSFKKFSVRVLERASNYRVPAGVTSAAIQKFLEALDCPRALTVAILFREGEHEQLAKLEFDPVHYRNLVHLRDSYAATAFLSKYKSLSLDYDLDAVAMEKFWKFELLCKETNGRFRFGATDPLFKGTSVYLHHAVRRKIDSILGRPALKHFVELANWGPGASTLIKSADASSPNKFQCETGITRDLYTYLSGDNAHALRVWYPAWHEHLIQLKEYPSFQVGNQVVTVPKNAQTNRVIAIEPGINLWFQKAIGEMIGRRLRRCGIDLRYQEDNQHLAYLGSKDSRLATVDFSSASDSISLEVVRELLPDDWFELLNATRSHFGLFDDKPHLWAKFSSMGNGFTFQLESLIFYAIAFCVTDYLGLDVEEVSVYGDDVIIPSESYELFASLSEFYGFLVNPAKSFSAGLFRESCGAHYFEGVDVKPFYLKDRPKNVDSIYRLANGIRRLSHRFSYSRTWCDDRFRSVHTFLVKSVPKLLRFYIPETLGDGGFIENFDVALPTRCKHWIEGYNVSNLINASLTREFDGVGLLLARLWIPSSLSLRRSDKNSVAMRGRTEFLLSRSLVAQWYDLGPWL